ncbi:unnamed protein product [Blepharisma stoltei]|uniref:ditrans,polycis-polyprenyl diphosphate synthase [(2E,6E)-farnesyldiphosphate specific] n=1 Tax=Blepharisma stoltei TaxID=1481888 RepID=A0AAU9JA36_9CILI|nr:unnamed protein product [Blepharisma stoltei]
MIKKFSQKFLYYLFSFGLLSLIYSWHAICFALRFFWYILYIKIYYKCNEKQFFMTHRLSRVPKHLTVSFQEELPSEKCLQNIVNWCTYLNIEYLTFYSPGFAKKYDLQINEQQITVRFLNTNHGIEQILRITKEISEKCKTINRAELAEKLNRGLPLSELVISIGKGDGMQYKGIPISYISLSELYYLGRFSTHTVIDFYKCLFKYSISEQRVGK